jgi:glutamine synthetase
MVGRGLQLTPPGGSTTGPFRSGPSLRPVLLPGSKTASPAPTPTYLVIAASLLCGLRGIEKGMKAGAPFVGNAYRATWDQAKPLATSLEQAVGLFEASEVLPELFGANFVEHYLDMKKWEIARTNTHVTDWELGRYLEII